MIGWNIVRNKPLARTLGRAIPTFIHNASYHLTTVDAYADGAINCWGFVDLPLFRTKVARGWVDPRPAVGSDLSIHNLGGGKVVEAKWRASPQDVERQVEEAVREMNPSMRDLIDMAGDDTEPWGKVRRAKLGLADEQPYRLDEQGEEVLGDEVPVVVPVEVGGTEGVGRYRLTRWFVYADGRAQLGYGTELVPLEQVAAALEGDGWGTSMPDGAWLLVEGLGEFRLAGGYWWVDPRERVRECRDQVDMLRGMPGSIRYCREKFQEYEAEPNEARREDLRAAYEAVPEHLRVYCGDMDSKDWPIRRAIYGPEAREDDGADSEDGSSEGD